MQAAYNRLVGITLENFRTFGRQQEIPIRPITLIYGPNNSGKSTVLNALRWMRNLRRGEGLSLLPRHCHRFDPTKMVRLGYEIAFKRTLKSDNAGVREAITQSVENLRVETSFATSELVGQLLDRIDQKVGEFHRYSLPAPHLWDAALLVNNKPFLRLKLEIQWMTRETLTMANCALVLRVAEFAAKHPLTTRLVLEARKQAIRELESLIEQSQNLAQRIAKDLPKSPMEVLKKMLQSYTEALVLLKAFDIRSIQASDLIETAQELCFLPDSFPPRALLQPAILSSWKLRLPTDDEGFGFEISQQERKIESPESLILEHFNHLLAVTTHWLTEPKELNFRNDPITDLIYIPPTRSIPAQSFVITDPVEHARNVPDWPFANADTFAKANEWLRSLGRPDTNYELYSQPGELLEGPGDIVQKSKQLRFSGVKDVAKNVMVQFDELGAGFSQLVPILLAAFNREDSVVLVEQPEIHLHPALQAELADLFAITASSLNAVQDSNEFKQFIIETHSEYLLLRLMRRIRETTEDRLPPGKPRLTPGDVAVLYVENHGDHSTVSEMPINEQGELVRDWPGGFFEEGLRELLI